MLFVVAETKNKHFLCLSTHKFVKIVKHFRFHGTLSEIFQKLSCFLDVNECVENSRICQNGLCVNVIGGYRCQCAAGYRPSSDQKRCLGKCLG